MASQKEEMNKKKRSLLQRRILLLRAPWLQRIPYVPYADRPSDPLLCRLAEIVTDVRRSPSQFYWGSSFDPAFVAATMQVLRPFPLPSSFFSASRSLLFVSLANKAVPSSIPHQPVSLALSRSFHVSWPLFLFLPSRAHGFLPMCDNITGEKRPPYSDGNNPYFLMPKLHSKRTLIRFGGGGDTPPVAVEMDKKKKKRLWWRRRQIE